MTIVSSGHPGCHLKEGAPPQTPTARSTGNYERSRRAGAGGGGVTDPHPNVWRWDLVRLGSLAPLGRQAGNKISSVSQQTFQGFARVRCFLSAGPCFSTTHSTDYSGVGSKGGGVAGGKETIEEAATPSPGSSFAYRQKTNDAGMGVTEPSCIDRRTEQAALVLSGRSPYQSSTLELCHVTLVIRPQSRVSTSKIKCFGAQRGGGVLS